MKTVQLMIRLLALSALVLVVGGCSPKHDEREQPDGGDGNPLGCCQEGPDACSAPVTESECLETDGSFHEGKACNLNSGKCGDGL